MERLVDNLIGHMRTIEVARIDMVHSSLNGLSQDSDRTVKIARRSPDSWTRQLHRPVTHAMDNPRTVGKCVVSAKVPLFGHSVFLLTCNPVASERRAVLPALQAFS
jgi:hypothetical protein